MVGKVECYSLVSCFPQKLKEVYPLCLYPTEHPESQGDSQLLSSTASGPCTSALCSECLLMSQIP